MEPIKDLKFVTSVDLGLYTRKKKSSQPYHFVYGSQLYDTLFGVFGKFDVQEDSSGTYFVKGVKLRIFNYKGSINIGFIKDYHHFGKENGKHHVYFAVRGTSKKFQTSILFNKPITVKQGERTPLIFNRILYPLPGFEFNIRIRNNRNLRSRSKRPIPHSALFDPEFQYRSGIDYFDHALKPGMLGYEDIDIEKIIAGTRFPSERCSQSRINLFR